MGEETLVEYVAEHGHHKYDHYFPFYDEILTPYRRRELRLLEIGISAASIRMWAECFPCARIVGLDQSERDSTGFDLGCLRSDRVEIIFGDQADVDLLEGLGNFDVVIDDGGHRMHEQITSFKTLFPKMSPGGWYCIEDLHTSYTAGYEDWPTTIDFLKYLLDDLHARYRGQSQQWPIRELRLVDSLVAMRANEQSQKI